MNADRRIVPARHVSSVLAEDGIGERTIEIKNTLRGSPNKLDNVAHKWIDGGMNSLARVMINNVQKVPQKENRQHQVDKDHGHDSHGHDSHGHDSHGHDSHHGHEAHHGHEHNKNGFASFVHTGHWCGEHGQHIFGMLGRLLGEIVGYCVRLLIVIMLFGPTRTGLLVIVLGYVSNTLMETNLPILGLGGAALIVHLILHGIGQIAGGGGEHAGAHGGGHSEHH